MRTPVRTLVCLVALSVNAAFAENGQTVIPLDSPVMDDLRSVYLEAGKMPLSSDLLDMYASQSGSLMPTVEALGPLRAPPPAHAFALGRLRPADAQKHNATSRLLD